MHGHFAYVVPGMPLRAVPAIITDVSQLQYCQQCRHMSTHKADGCVGKLLQIIHMYDVVVVFLLCRMWGSHWQWRPLLTCPSVWITFATLQGTSPMPLVYIPCCTAIRLLQTTHSDAECTHCTISAGACNASAAQHTRLVRNYVNIPRPAWCDKSK
jgi:hypothetical protein